MDCMQFGQRLMDSSSAAGVCDTACVCLCVCVCVYASVYLPYLPPSLPPPPPPPSLISQDLGLNLAHYQTQPIHKQLFKNLHQEKGKLRYSRDQQDWFQTWHDNHCKPSAAIISRKKGQCIGRNNDAFCMIGKAQSCFTGFSTRGSKGSNFFCFL